MTLPFFNRRSALRASAWTLPAVAVAASAPAFATSTDRGPLFEVVEINGNRRTLRITNRSSQTLIATLAVPSTVVEGHYHNAHFRDMNYLTYDSYRAEGDINYYLLSMSAGAQQTFHITWAYTLGYPATTNLTLSSPDWPSVVLPITLG